MTQTFALLNDVAGDGQDDGRNAPSSSGTPDHRRPVTTVVAAVSRLGQLPSPGLLGVTVDAHITAITATDQMTVTQARDGGRTSIVKRVRAAFGRQTMLVRPANGGG